MIANNGNTNKRSSMKNFLSKVNNNNINTRMPVAIPSASNSTPAKLFQSSMAPSSSQLRLASLLSTLSSSHSVPTSLRTMPCTILDEIRQLQQQKQQFEELKQEQLLEANLSAMQSQQHHHHEQEAVLQEFLKKQNAMLWECMKGYECTINNLEENLSGLTRAHARLKVDLHDQIEINKNLVQRNTDIVLDTSAKDGKITLLKEQRKCLTKQNSQLKNFLRQTDSCLDTLQNQQVLLQQRQHQMQQKSAAVGEDDPLRSASKKRKRVNQVDDELSCNEAIDNESTHTINGKDGAKDANNCDVIIIEDDNTDNQEMYISDDRVVTNSCNTEKRHI